MLMRLLRFRTLLAALVSIIALITSSDIPGARAGICKVLARKVLGTHSSHHHKRKVVRRRRSAHRTTSNHTIVAHPHIGKVAQAQKAPSPQQLKNRSSLQYPSFFPWKTQPSNIPPTNSTPLRGHEDLIESNDQAFSTRASWYGPGFDGRRTASGARFHQYGLTAASRTLPLGSKVLVANPTTGKCCTVTINDRGPYIGGRDIDLSKGAAARIGVTGVSPVICVAYANPKEAGSSSTPTTPQSQSSSNGRHFSKNRTRHRRNSAPIKTSGKVMHLIAGILP